jgi:hypothetical protein
MDDGSFGQVFNNQSRNYCFAMKILIGKDTKKAFQEFAGILKFLKI